MDSGEHCRRPQGGCAFRGHPPPEPKGIPTMLTIFGQKNRYCDGISRRSFLQIGTLSFGAGFLSLADLFRAEARGETTSRHKGIINIFLGGGPPHQDMWEIKTEAPAE